MGITFTVYHEQDGSIDRAWPLDIIPRTISRKEWQKIEAGLMQRAAALNLFIDDIYHEQKFIKDGLMPASIIATSKNFRAGVQRHQAAARHLGAHLRLGPDARQGRHGLRARGQPARAVGRVVHAREPPGDEARVPRAVRERRHPAGGRLPLAALRHAARAVAAQGEPARGRGAHAGHLQLGVLRARLPRAADGLRAGRGPRPRGRQRRRASTCRPCAAGRAST